MNRTLNYSYLLSIINITVVLSNSEKKEINFIYDATILFNTMSK